ncbi:MAG: inorganic pyrophosphatase [Bacteroidetes bacterium]|nr:inorganic pyrophosphatase [Bacteroidota bacterium]
MAKEELSRLWEMIGLRYTSHPWHGISIGELAPDEITAYIEVVPTDTVKYEIDKESGYMKVDRPQKFSNHVPALYGFIPQTYCWERVANLCRAKTGRKELMGDGDPLDICVLTERHIEHGNLLVKAIPIGGFRMIDGGEADDKIIAIMKNDEVYQHWRDIEYIPETLIARLRHYFLTYKDMPGLSKKKTEITHIYYREEAHGVIRRSIEDYQDRFGDVEEQMTAALWKALDFDEKSKLLKSGEKGD